MIRLQRLCLACLFAALPLGVAFAAPNAAGNAAKPLSSSPAAVGSAPSSTVATKSSATSPDAGHHTEPASNAGDETSPEAGTANAKVEATGDPQADVNEPSAALEPGTISARIVSSQGVPLAGQQVRLGILFQKIAEGESRSEKFAQADANGMVRFSGLTVGSDHAYRVTVQVGTASYKTSPFNLKPEMGQRVVLHVYPSTSEVEQAQIGMRGYLYIETRDDVFQFEAMFRVFNVGQVTWVPKDVVVQLPHGFKAFKAQEGMTDVRFEESPGVGAKLKGTFSPGQNEASFRFQVPKSNGESATFHMTVPPHVAEMRIIAEASATMNLEVDGFQPPVATANNNGQRVLVSVKQLLRRDEEFKDFTATLTGIPTPGSGRWVAVLIAGALAIAGVLSARGAFEDVVGGRDASYDKKRARELLLRELVALEAAREGGRIGPRSYEQSRVALIDAIARLGLPTERERERKNKSPRTARKLSKSAAERT